ncbi:MAG: hypothetical protein HXY25_01575 [Alphaproteobacteria bacterium]|nr:hypothetical protein [Alphaproteobacteria bacterium]
MRMSRLSKVGLVVVTMASLGGAASSVRGQDLYKADPGPRTIELADSVTLKDEKRGKEIPLRITFPAGTDKVPALVFSHGAWAARYFYAPLARHWASHGYAVIQPTHEDSSDFGNSWDDPSVFADDLRFGRPEDLSAIVDVINALGVPGLDGRIDLERIAVGGHSYGADTAMMAAGLVLDDGKGLTVDRTDPRFKAVISLSGQGLGEGRTVEGFANVAIPMMLLTGSRDPARGDRPHTWRLDAFNYSSPPHKYLVFIEGVDHGFGMTVMPDPEFPQPPDSGVRRWLPDAVHAAATKSATTAFLDAFVNGDTAALEFLTSDRMETATDGIARITRK